MTSEFTEHFFNETKLNGNGNKNSANFFNSMKN